jgi:hypothetical protein
MLARFHEWPDRVRVTIHPGTTTRLPAPVVSSVMVAAWVTLTASPVVKNVTNSVSHLSYSVTFVYDSR